MHCYSSILSRKEEKETTIKEGTINAPTSNTVYPPMSSAAPTIQFDQGSNTSDASFRVSDDCSFTTVECILEEGGNKGHSKELKKLSSATKTATPSLFHSFSKMEKDETKCSLSSIS